MQRILLVACVLLLLVGCTHKKPATTPTVGVDYTRVQTPLFVADSAYAYAQAQLAFGYRIPGTAAHRQCAQYLMGQMRRWCDTVVAQEFRAELWDGHVAEGCNIIASLRPELPNRVLLAAHWDSRTWADQEDDPTRRRQPVPGANDGASGVAVLMEMARIMAQQPPSIGVDFVLFDVEDQGVAEWSDVYDEHSWCKGSQYWAETPHVPYYRAVYGVLFDMVGCPEPRFTKEYFSRQYAPGLTDKLWRAASALGYGHIFVNQATDPILDDHLYVNQLAGIPMVDIVQNSAHTSFFSHWHTTTDDLESLNVSTMQAVARVVLATLYADYPSQP